MAGAAADTTLSSELALKPTAVASMPTKSSLDNGVVGGGSSLETAPLLLTSVAAAHSTPLMKREPTSPVGKAHGCERSVWHVHYQNYPLVESAQLY